MAATIVLAMSRRVPVSTPTVTLLALCLFNTSITSVLEQINPVIIDAYDHLLSFATIPTFVFSLEQPVVEGRANDGYTYVHQYNPVSERVPWCVFCTILEEVDEYL